jgi:hypothetical protein
MESLKYHPGPPCPTLLRPQGGPPPNSLTAILGVARPYGRWPGAVFYPLGHSTPYDYGTRDGQKKSVVLVVWTKMIIIRLGRNHKLMGLGLGGAGVVGAPGEG